MHDPDVRAQRSISLQQLLLMRSRELIELYTASPSGAIPDGEAHGVALIAPGTPLGRPLAFWTHLVWQGKTFDAARGRLLNRITPLGIAAIAADVYAGKSLVDEKACIVLDYSKTSTVARFVRDEIRNVAPRTYLGFAFVSRLRTIAFGLQFIDSQPALA